MDGSVISVERVVPTSASSIFDLLADPTRHPDIDGSGTVKEAKVEGPRRLAMGTTFGMAMQMGIRYSMVNTVIEFEENRRIAWQARPKGFVGNLVGGRIWRYELDPVEGGTKVTESWDISDDHQRVLLRLGKLPETTRSNMAKTLARIEELTASGT